MIDWSFHSLFDRKVERACSVAKSSRVCVELPSSGVYRVFPEPQEIRGRNAFYDLKDGAYLVAFSRLRVLIQIQGSEAWDIGTMWPTDFEYRA